MSSSARFGIDPAPGGLVLVQELVNTSLLAMPVPDLLGELDDAQPWLDQALARWSVDPPAIALRTTDLPRLRALREAVRALMLRGPASALPAQHVELELRDGEVGLRPTGEGWRAVSALVLAELLLAQRTGAWERVKSCHNPACGAAFYDRTRNGSRIWHDTKTCGNVMNLRASRARRKAPAAPDPPR